MEHLTINQKKYPVKAAYSVITNFCITRNIQYVNDFYTRLGDVSDKISVEYLQDLAYAALALVDRGCEADGSVNDLKLNDVIDWLGESEENPVKVMELILKCTGRTNTAQDTKKKKVKA